MTFKACVDLRTMLAQQTYDMLVESDEASGYDYLVWRVVVGGDGLYHALWTGHRRWDRPSSIEVASHAWCGLTLTRDEVERAMAPINCIICAGRR